MAEAADKRSDDRALPWTTCLGVAALGVGVLFYVWVLTTRPDNAEFWGVMGDSVAPFTAMFSAAALFAALLSVHLQRRELELQRAELRETREEMTKQREQFERTARAQEALADAQRLAAQRQLEANTQTAKASRDAERAQRSANLAVLQAAAANVRIAALDVAPARASDIDSLNEELEKLSLSMAREISRLSELGERFGG